MRFGHLYPWHQSAEGYFYTAVVESDVAGLELERVIPKVSVLFERDDKFFANIEKRDVEKISNRLMRVPLELRPGGNFGYFNADGGDLGRGGGPTWNKATLNSVFLKEGIEYTKLTQWSTDSDRKAVVSAVRRLTATALKEIRRQLDAQSMQDGSGIIGTIETATPGAGFDTYLLDPDFGARLMRYGQTVQIWNSAGAVLKGTGTITQWDVANDTIQVTPNIGGTPTAGDLIVTSGISDPTALEGLYGVPYQHSASATGTWLGLPRSSTPEIRSNEVDAAGNGLSLPLPRLAINKIGDRVGIDNTFKPEAWCHPCQKQAYEEIGQLVSVIFKKASEEGLNMYFNDNMQMAGAPVRDSFNWNKTRIDFIVKEVWGRGEILPIGFYKSDGRSIFEIRGASGGVATADIFYMTVGMQFFVSNPAGTAYIADLAIPSGYGH